MCPPGGPGQDVPAPGDVFRPQSSGRSAWGWGGGGRLRCAPSGSCNHTDTGRHINEPHDEPAPVVGSWTGDRVLD